MEGPIGGTGYGGGFHTGEGEAGGGVGDHPSPGRLSGARHSLLLRYIINPSDGECSCCTAVGVFSSIV